MKDYFYLLTLILGTSSVLSYKEFDFLSDDFINSINEEQSSWKAGRNFDANTPISRIVKLMGVIPSNRSEPAPTKTFHPAKFLEIPEHFDAREQWPQCKSIRHITDQSSCASCWAIAAASAMSDRLCIKSKGKIQATVSTADILSCCTGSCGNGCNRGSIDGPWKYWVEKGISTGGDYGSKDGCINYPFPPCNHMSVESSKPFCDEENVPVAPKCQMTCDGPNKKITKQLTFGKNYYNLTSVEQMQVDILENGPIEAGMALFTDFFSYKSGVYKQIKGGFAGFHAVKILGWGVENGTSYWLVANSWNEEWGDNGYFKIARGSKESGIEELDVYAGEPLL